MSEHKPPDKPEIVNPPIEGAREPPGAEKPPAVPSEELDKMVEAGLKANREAWESEEVNLEGAGPQPLDDGAFGGDD